MIRIYIITLIVALALFGCTKPDIDVSAPELEPPDVEQEQEPEPEFVSDDNSYTLAVDPTIFNFADMPEDDFPRGTWTANQLIEKYGAPESVTAYYVAESGAVGIDFIHEDIKIHLVSWQAELFSPFYELIQKKGAYGLNDKEKLFDLSAEDKNIELLINGLWFYDNIVEFPRGIRISESTKQDILDAYHEAPAHADTWYSQDGEADYYDYVCYLYAFKDQEDGNNGDVSYFFDENEILWRIDIAWWWGH